MQNQLPLVNIAVVKKSAEGITVTNTLVRGIKLFDYEGGTPMIVEPNRTYVLTDGSFRCEVIGDHPVNTYEHSVTHCIVTTEAEGNITIIVSPGNRLTVQEFAFSNFELEVVNGKLMFFPIE